MPRTAALLGMALSLAPLACATSVHPGLANAPALGSTPVAADASVRDVVANGRDSCERGLGPGPLRYQVPPCPGVERAAAATPIVNPAPSAKGIVIPWVEHYYSPWPCSSSDQNNEANRMTLGHLASPRAAPDRALSGPTCTWPL